MENYNPFKTAITRTHLSKPMHELVRRGLLKGDMLDYGCGKGLDSKYLWADYNIQTWRYDKFNLEFKDDFLLKEKYDTITCLYVFNVIQSLSEHEQLVQQLREIGKDIYICVRSDSTAIKSTWLYDEQNRGWITPKNTFQRFYDVNMVNEMFGDVEYISNTSELKLFRLK